MMWPLSNRRFRYGLCFLGALCFVCGLLWYRHHTSPRQRFLSKLRVAILDASTDKTHTFTMASLTDFAWDGLFIFGPYTPVDEIEKALGFSWPPAHNSNIYCCETFCLLVFTHKNRVVQYCEYQRGDGDFSSLSSTRKIAATAAVFSVVRDKNGWLVVTMTND